MSAYTPIPAGLRVREKATSDEGVIVEYDELRDAPSPFKKGIEGVLVEWHGRYDGMRLWIELDALEILK